MHQKKARFFLYFSLYVFFLFVRFRLDSDSFPWKLSWFRSQNTFFGKPHCSRLRQFCACWVLSQILSLSRGSYHQQSQGCFTSQLLNCRDEREKRSHLESRGYLVESAKRPPASWWDCVFMEFKRNCASRPMNPLTDLAYHQFQAEGFNVKIIKQICLSDSSGRQKTCLVSKTWEFLQILHGGEISWLLMFGRRVSKLAQIMSGCHEICGHNGGQRAFGKICHVFCLSLPWWIEICRVFSPSFLQGLEKLCIKSDFMA